MQLPNRLSHSCSVSLFPHPALVAAPAYPPPQSQWCKPIAGTPELLHLFSTGQNKTTLPTVTREVFNSFILQLRRAAVSQLLISPKRLLPALFLTNASLKHEACEEMAGVFCKKGTNLWCFFWAALRFSNSATQTAPEEEKEEANARQRAVIRRMNNLWDHWLQANSV